MNGMPTLDQYLVLSAILFAIGTAGVFVRQELNVEDIVGRAFSQSLPVPTPAFEADLRAGLAALSPEGRFVEIAELVAVVAEREGVRR